MRALLDACVLYPTIMRETLLGAASAGLFQPLWSARILEEWARAARKIGPEGETIARGEIALIKARWPKSLVAENTLVERALWLPDANDTHVLASAIEGQADLLVTVNNKDFPSNILAEHGLSRSDPDHLLLGFYRANPDALRAVARSIQEDAIRLSGQDQLLRKLFKKARLPRFAKALSNDSP